MCGMCDLIRYQATKETIMGGKPSKGTKADKRLRSNKGGAVPPAKSGKGLPFGGKQAAPFKKGGGRRGK